MLYFFAPNGVNIIGLQINNYAQLMSNINMYVLPISLMFFKMFYIETYVK